MLYWFSLTRVNPNPVWDSSIAIQVDATQYAFGDESTLHKVTTMIFGERNVIEVDGTHVDLKNRYLAAFLAWLVPGAGHFYQGRYAKAGIFVVCILATWIHGFAIGGGHVVYASMVPGDMRWHYALQAGVGAAALPALIQTHYLSKHTDPLTGRTDSRYDPLWRGFMAPPKRPIFEDNADEVSAWYARRGAGYEMGAWYTMIAGLLNILVIYDAYSGPLAVPISGRRRDENSKPDDESSHDDRSNEAVSKSKTEPT
jgi:hypothetical protein